MTRRPFRLALFCVLAAHMVCIHARADLDPERWRWSNPLPHGNNVLDMYVRDADLAVPFGEDADLAVQVGDGGTVYIRRSTSRWAPAVTGVTNYLRGTTLLKSRFIVAGENGCILWSDDGNEFAPAEVLPPTSDWFEGVAANAQRGVAVGDNGSIYASTNGLQWTQGTSGTAEWLRGVAAGNGSFVAVGENGTVLHSVAGATWTPVAPFTTAHLNRVRFLGSGSSAQYVAVGNEGVAFASPTGDSGWVSLNSGLTNNIYDVAQNDDGLLLVGDREIHFQELGSTDWVSQVTDLVTNAPSAWVYLSASGSSNQFLVAGRTGLLYEGTRPDGATNYSWQPVPDSSHAWLWDVTMQNGTYVAVGDLATILTSLDGIVWAREVVPGNVTNTVLLGVGGDSNRLFSVGNTGTVYVSHAGLTNITITNVVGTNIVVTNTTIDTLGIIWTNVTGISTQNLQGVASTGGDYLICGAQGNVYFSNDGTNWIHRPTPTTNFLSSVTDFAGGWIAVGAGGTLLRAGVDASNWTIVPMSTTNWLYRVRRFGSQLITVGQNGTLYVSMDGTNWTNHATGTSQWLNDATFIQDTWFVTGTQGLLLSSTNLVNWTRQRLPTIKSLFAAAAWDGQLVLAGIEGVVLRNQFVSRTSPVDLLDYDRLIATNTVSSGTNAITEVNAYELFLFGGVPDQHFQLQHRTNALDAPWSDLTRLELYDSSGTLYLIRTRDPTATPAQEYYRTQLIP